MRCKPQKQAIAIAMSKAGKYKDNSPLEKSFNKWREKKNLKIF